jgi:hypothetical protein
MKKSANVVVNNSKVKGKEVNTKQKIKNDSNRSDNLNNLNQKSGVLSRSKAIKKTKNE